MDPQGCYSALKMVYLVLPHMLLRPRLPAKNATAMWLTSKRYVRLLSTTGRRDSCRGWNMYGRMNKLLVDKTMWSAAKLLFLE